MADHGQLLIQDSSAMEARRVAFLVNVPLFCQTRLTVNIGIYQVLQYGKVPTI